MSVQTAPSAPAWPDRWKIELHQKQLARGDTPTALCEMGVVATAVIARVGPESMFPQSQALESPASAPEIGLG